MSYVNPNFKTKAELKKALKNGETVACFEPGIGGQPNGTAPDGVAFVEGPHYPEPHRWYASVLAKDGKVVKVRT